MNPSLTYSPCSHRSVMRTRFAGPVLSRAFASQSRGSNNACRGGTTNRRGNHFLTNGVLRGSVFGGCQIRENLFRGFCAGQRLVRKRRLYGKTKSSSFDDFSDLDFDSVSNPDNPDFDEIKLDEDFYKSMGMTKEEAEQSQQFRAEDADPEAGRFNLEDIASLAPDIPDYVKEGLSKGVMFGPPTILLAGFLVEELPMVRYVVDAAGGQAVKVVPVTDEMLHKHMEEVVELPEPDWEKPRPDDFMRGGGWGAQRAIVFGGMKVEAQAAVIELLEEGGLPPICPMAATEETKRMKLGELLADAVKYQRFRKNPENDLWKVNERAAKDLPDVENYLEKSIKDRVQSVQEGMESGMMDLEEDEDGILQVKFKKEVVDRHNRGRKTPQQTYEEAIRDWGPEMSEDELRDKFGGMDSEEMKKMVEELKDGEAFEQWMKQQEAAEEEKSADNGSPDLRNGGSDGFDSGKEEEEAYPDDLEILESLRQVQAERMASERESTAAGEDVEDLGIDVEHSETVKERGGEEGDSVGSEGSMDGLKKNWMDSGSLELKEELPVMEDLKDPVVPETVEMPEDSCAEADFANTEATKQEVELESGDISIERDSEVQNEPAGDSTKESVEKSGQASATEKPSLEDGAYEGDFFAIDNLVGETLGLDPLKRPEPEPQMTMQEMLELPLGKLGDATEPRAATASSAAVDGENEDKREPTPSVEDSVGKNYPSNSHSGEKEPSDEEEMIRPPTGGSGPLENDSNLEVVEADEIISGEPPQEREAEADNESKSKRVAKSKVPANTIEEFNEYMKDQKNEIEYNPEEHGHLFESPMKQASQFTESESKSNRREVMDETKLDLDGKKESVEAALRDAVENGVDPEELKRMIDGLANKQKSSEDEKSRVTQGGGIKGRKPVQKVFRSRFSYDDEPPEAAVKRQNMMTNADIIPMDDEDLEVVEEKLVTQGDWDSVFGRPFYEKPPVPEEEITKSLQSQPVEDLKSRPEVEVSPEETEPAATLTKSELAAVAERQGLDLDDLLADARGRGIHISE